MSALSVQICEDCWKSECLAHGNPDLEAIRVTAPELEHCYDCGKLTNSGIYVRRQQKETVQ